MNINTKPTTSTVTEDDYALISQNSAVRRASFAEIVEFMQLDLFKKLQRIQT